MSTSDLITLLADYLAVLAIVIAFLSTQVEAWKNQILALESEWSEEDHRSNNLLKVRHEAKRNALSNAPPKFAVYAPVILSVVLLGLGSWSLYRADSAVCKSQIAILLFVPFLLLLVAYMIYGGLSIKNGKNKLTALK